eukprot:gene13257-13387_t
MHNVQGGKQVTFIKRLTPAADIAASLHKQQQKDLGSSSSVTAPLVRGFCVPLRVVSEAVEAAEQLRQQQVREGLAALASEQDMVASPVWGGLLREAARPAQAAAAESGALVDTPASKATTAATAARLKEHAAISNRAPIRPAVDSNRQPEMPHVRLSAAAGPAKTSAAEAAPKAAAAQAAAVAGSRSGSASAQKAARAAVACSLERKRAAAAISAGLVLQQPGMRRAAAVAVEMLRKSGNAQRQGYDHIDFSLDIDAPCLAALAGAVQLPDGCVYLHALDLTLPADLATFPWESHGGLYRRQPKMVSLKAWYGDDIREPKAAGVKGKVGRPPGTGHG